MKAKCHELTQRVPIRVRVGFARAVAERVLPALARHAEGLVVAHKTLVHCWKCVETETARALELYEECDEALVLQGSLKKDEMAAAAINTLTSAYYFTLWHVYKQDLRNGRVRAGDVPMMTEITEEVLEEVCLFAQQTSFCGDDWIAESIDRLVRDYYSADPDDLGPVMAMACFVE